MYGDKNKTFILDIPLSQFWVQSFTMDGVYNMQDFIDHDPHFYNCHWTEWDNGKKDMSWDIIIEGLPGYDKAPSTSVLTLNEHTDHIISVEIETKTHELPMSDSFVCHEVWVIIQSPTNKN